MSAIPNQPAESISLGRLKSLGVLAPEFVPFLLPTRYLDLNHDQLTTGFADLRDGDKVILYGTLVECSVHRNSVPSRTVAKLVDEYGHEITATFFGDPRIYATDLDGKLHCKVCFAGQIGYYMQFTQLRNPAFIDTALIGRVVPVYPGKAKVIAPETVFEHLQHSLLSVTIPMAVNWLRQKLKWSSAEEAQRLSVMKELSTYPTIETLLNVIHFPPSVRHGLLACRLLKLIATYDVLTGARAETYRERTIHSAIYIPTETLDCLMSETDLKPTEEQRDVIREICTDIASDQPMLRLLSADVGFGKTYVAAAAGAAVVRNGGTVVWLCPNIIFSINNQLNQYLAMLAITKNSLKQD